MLTRLSLAPWPVFRRLPLPFGYLSVAGLRVGTQKGHKLLTKEWFVVLTYTPVTKGLGVNHRP